MIFWLVIFSTLYMGALAYSSYIARKQQTGDPKVFTLGGGNLNLFLGVLTYSATLFSTFTLMGMPNFFRIHGVGAWIFLGVTDVAMAMVILLFGLKVRKVFREKNYLNIGSFLKGRYSKSIAAWVFLIGIFVFLVPYSAIQIKGIAQFLKAVAPIDLPISFWAVSMLAVILTYSTVGGFNAIVYSDAIQGIILLGTSWAIAYLCLSDAGGITELFRQVRQINPELLSVPGPKGLFSVQFLIASFLAIVLMPICQPQLTTRVVAMKSEKKLLQMAPSIAFFAIIVIFPAVILGMYGAAHYANLSAQDFWAKILVFDQHPMLGALAMIGLLAAAMSTTDSQLFALGNEANLLLGEQDKKSLLNTKLLIFIFAVASLVLAIFSKGGLIPLARLSFAGTSIMAPMVLAPILSKREKLGMVLPAATFIGLIWFLLAQFTSTVPKVVLGLRLELFLYAILGLICLVEVLRKDVKGLNIVELLVGIFKKEGRI